MTLLPDLADLSASALFRCRAEVLTAAERAPDAAAMLGAASAALARYVPSDAEGWSVADPATMLPTWPIHVDHVPRDHSCDYWDREFLGEESLLFRDLAARAVPVGRLQAETSGFLARSRRYRESLALQGFSDELRAVLRVSGAVWGLVDLVRGIGAAPFSDAEASFVASLASPLARILRAKVVGTPAGLVAAPQSPGVLWFDTEGALVSCNDAAQSWLQEIPNEAGALEGIPSPVSAVLAYARAVARGYQSGPARLRVRARSGQWIVVDASCLSSSEGAFGGIAVVIERATSAEVVPIIVSAYELSAREQQIIRLVAQGRSTSGIASELFLSVYTVRDYIKAIFGKVGVSSRGELVARLFTDHFERPAELTSVAGN